LELGIGTLGQITRMMGLPGRERSLTIPSAVWAYMNMTDRRMDRQRDRRMERRTPGNSKDHAKHHAVKIYSYSNSRLITAICRDGVMGCI